MVNMLLISGLRPTTGVYISIFKVDLAGNKRLIELRYGMDITVFYLLFKLQIYSRKLGNVGQNKKPLKLDNYRGITTEKVILISFYG